MAADLTDSDAEETSVKLPKPCLCKSQSARQERTSCFEPFREPQLHEELKEWRKSFRDLHKLDQDRLDSQVCLNKVFSFLLWVHGFSEQGPNSKQTKKIFGRFFEHVLFCLSLYMNGC